MEFEGEFTTQKHTVLSYPLVYGIAKAKYKKDILTLKMTYSGSYRCGLTYKIKLQKIKNNKYTVGDKEYILRGIEKDETIFAGYIEDQIFALHFSSDYIDLHDIKIKETIEGGYISINPGDIGTMIFKRTK
jgi:hypothetical protein